MTNSPYLELMEDPPALSVMEVQGMIEEPFTVDAEGYVSVPDRPGLGVEISDRWEKIASG